MASENPHRVGENVQFAHPHHPDRRMTGTVTTVHDDVSVVSADESGELFALYHAPLDMDAERRKADERAAQDAAEAKAEKARQRAAARQAKAGSPPEEDDEPKA